MLDDLWRKTMSLERNWRHTPTVAAPARSGHRLNVSMPVNLTGRRSFGFHQGQRSAYRSAKAGYMTASSTAVLSQFLPCNTGGRPYMTMPFMPMPLIQVVFNVSKTGAAIIRPCGLSRGRECPRRHARPRPPRPSCHGRNPGDSSRSGSGSFHNSSGDNLRQRKMAWRRGSGRQSGFLSFFCTAFLEASALSR